MPTAAPVAPIPSGLSVTESLPDGLPPDEPSPPPAPAAAPPQRRGLSWLLGLLLLLSLGAVALLHWHWQGQRAHAALEVEGWREAAAAAAAASDRLAGDLDAMRERQRGLEQRISELGSANRVLREELFGVGERAAALEDALTRLAQARSEGAQALKLDEIEFLLQLAAERLQLFGDPGNALRALTAVEASLDSLQDPLYAGLQQTLRQELAALRAHPGDIRPALRNELGAVQRLIGQLPAHASAEPPPPGQHRLLGLLDGLVKVRRVDPQGVLLTPLERAARRSALELQLTLAQGALERPDHEAWTLALDQALALLERLFDGEAAEQLRQRLRALRDTPLASEPPALGATLLELRNLRTTRRLGSAGPAARAPEPAASAAAASADTPAIDDGPELERE
jgi:uroporphyrin-III C-methyltransferase